MVFGGLAAVCWAIAGLLALRTMRLSARVDGTVLRVAESSGEDSTTYHPVVEFTAASGEKVQFESRGTGRKNYDAGDTVPVRYHPDHPKRARIDRAIYAYQGAFSWVIIGIVVPLIPLFAAGGASGDAD